MFRIRLLLFLTLLLLGSPTRAAEPVSLQIRVEEGEGQTYLVGSRATRGITVLITDESGNPVTGASVNFTLPENGSTGAFPDGSKNQLIATRADGRATVWGMRWNRQAGPVDVRVVAGKGSARAGTTVTVHLTTAGPAVAAGSGSSHKWLWIGLAVAGAAGAGIAVAAKGGGSQSSCSSTVVLAASPCPSAADPLGVTVIGTPTINLGHP